MQFLGLGPWEILLIVIILLILLGPRKLPELARSMGEALKEFRRASSSLSGNEIKEVEGDGDRIRELALSLGIDVKGKTDDEIMREIREKIMEKK